MPKLWDDNAWEEYLYWQTHDKKMMKRINDLVKSIEREGQAVGLGKPEKLKYHPGWSRRIDKENRLIYTTDADGTIHILSCKDHYKD